MSESKFDKKSIFETIKTFAITVILIMLVRIFLIDATIVSGDSMNDTLATNDYLMVDKISPKLKGYDRGDIVIIKAPDVEDALYVKRIIGLPGELVDLKDGNFYIDGKLIEEPYTNEDFTYMDNVSLKNHWELSDREYFLVGDNRIEGISKDSRRFGPVDKDLFVGQAKFRLYPFDKIKNLD